MIRPMSIRDILLLIQYVTIAGLFVEGWMVIRIWRNRLHTYILFNCVVTLVNNIAYLMELKSGTEESYMTAVKISYAGRVWIAFSLFLFVGELTKNRIPDIVKNLLVLSHVFTYILVLTYKRSSLYYYDVRFDNTGFFPRFSHGNGPWHHVNTLVQFSYIVVGLFWLFTAYKKEKGVRARKRLAVVILAVFAEASAYIIYRIGIPGITEYYDITIIGYFLGTVFTFIAIFFYDLLGTGEIAREFMIDRLSEGVIAVDQNDIVQYFNENARKLYPDIGQDPDSVISELDKAYDAGENLVIKDRIYSVEKSKLNHEGIRYGRIYALVDETDHIKYMDELQHQRDIANRANESKSRFLTNMSHEIRTPINAVLGMDEMILRESREEEIRKYASDIMSAGRTLLSLINDILDLSKVEEGKMEIIPVQYDLSSLINDLVNMIKERAAGKGLRFNVEVDENIPHMLFGDEIRIRQCALNLLTNAVKYTEKGSVCMSVSFLKQDESHILLGFKVSDTGIGMKPGEMEKLFSPYERMDEERNRAVEGTGLGMSITRQLLQLMDSELDVKSEYGKGSEISFSILQEVVRWEAIGDYSDRFNEANGIRKEYHELFHAKDARILVVDDTEMNLAVMRSLLKKTGIHIDTALSGKDALTLAASNPYDILFIDHMMPGMDGIETLKRIRRSDRNRKTPAIAITANAVSGAREMYLGAGFDDYISKPVDGSSLEKLIIKLLPGEKIETGPQGDNDIAPDRVNADKSKILVIDDDEAVCALVKSIMEPVYEISECYLYADAFKTAKRFLPDLIMLDIHLKDGNGFELMQILKEDTVTSDIPVLLVTGDRDDVTEENGLKNGASDFIRKPFVPDVLKQRARRIIDLHNYQRSIEKEVRVRTAQVRRLTREMMLTLSRTVDIKDHYTDGHSRRVAALCAEIGRRLGKSPVEQVKLYEIGLLHDIGKIGIHEDIIRKTERLDDEEFKKVKAHTEKGYEILKEIKDMPELSQGARWHHERYDGSGYPDGLKGDEIPEFARIACIADCYDAMTSTRTYSVPKKQEDVRNEIVRCKGTWFDPRVADVLLTMIDEDTEYRMNENAGSGDVWKEYERLWDDPVTDAGDCVTVSSLPAWLEGIGDLDTGAGIKNCGSKEGFMSVLTVFHDTAAEKADEIERLYSEGNIKDYTIRVHALKSSARIIGAGGLSSLAEKLEDAGKKEDTAFIDENNAELLKRYRELNASLSPLDGQDGELSEITPEALKDAYQTIVEIAGSMDYGLLDELLKSLKAYRLDTEDDERIKRIGKLLDELDWEGIAKEAGGAVSK